MDDTRIRTITRISTPKMEAPRKMRVAAYCRVSVDFEVNLNSLNAQVDYYSKFIKANPCWEFAGVYADEGITGTMAERPGLERLLSSCDKGEIDIILTKSISRFARNTVILLEIVRHLREKGISIRFERENIDSMSDSGELLLTLLASFAQEESRSISENTRWAIRRNFEHGIGNHVSPMLGYRFDGERFVIQEAEARTVRLIFDLYLRGMSPDGITSYLNENGHRSVNGRLFKYGCVWDILRQIKYTGNSILQRTFTEDFISHRTKRNKGEFPQYYAEGTHPVIIPQETFDAVQEEIKRRKALGYLASTTKNFSAFTGKIVCAKCGRTFRRSNTGKPGRHKSNYYYWKCGTRFSKGKAGCDAPLIPEKELYRISAELGQEPESLKQILVKENVLSFHLNSGETVEKEVCRAGK